MSRKILIRFDDICPTMDWEQCNIAVDIMKEFGIKPLIGVIPKCEDPELKIMKEKVGFWEYIRELQANGFTIAMHGYTHRFDIEHKGIVNYGIKSEFAGHSYAEQNKKIRNGKRELEKHGIETDIFFAPAHSYDLTTLKVLSENGFKYVVDGKSKKPIMKSGIICIPCRDAGVPKIHKRGTYIAVFHAHEWTRNDKRAEFEKFKQICLNPDVCAFEDICYEPVGNTVIQILDEQLFMLYDKNIRPKLSRLKRTLLEKQ